MQVDRVLTSALQWKSEVVAVRAVAKTSPHASLWEPRHLLLQSAALAALRGVRINPRFHLLRQV
jgi:hypothetical protein